MLESKAYSLWQGNMLSLKLILLCLSISFINTVYGQEPSIVDDILPDIKRIGESGFLNCTVARLGSNSVTWTQDSGQLISRNEVINVANSEIEGLKRYEVKRQNSKNGDRITFTLIIRFLQEDDAGRYICSIETVGSSAEKYPQKYGIITVLAPPQIKLSITTTRVELKLGGSKTLLCNATGTPAPNITWVRTNGGLLPTLEHSHKGPDLHLKNMRSEDQGVYRCVADNTVRPPDHLDVRVYVISRPSVTYVQDTVGQAQNGKHSATLECKVSSYPDAVLSWFKKTSRGRDEIKDTDKYEIQKLQSSNLKLGETWYKLKVKNVQANDYGIYYCSGQNLEGTEETEIKLFETLECQGPNCYSPTGRGSTLQVYKSILFVLSVCYIFLTPDISIIS